MDTIKFEVEATLAYEGEENGWVGEVKVNSSGGIRRTLYTTEGAHPSSTKAENAAIVEFAAHLAELIV